MIESTAWARNAEHWHSGWRRRERRCAGARLWLPPNVAFANTIPRPEPGEQTDRLLAEFLAPGIVVLPFDAEDAAHAGDIRAHLERKGTPIGPCDVLIAAQARRRGATLVTLNAREFLRVPGLLVMDWAA